jgi:DNA-binding NtrC family response regulator
MERAVVFCADRTIELAHLPKEVCDFGSDISRAPFANGTAPPDAIPQLADAERLLVARVLRITDGNQSQAARLLGVERHRLRRLIARHRLEQLLNSRPH